MTNKIRRRDHDEHALPVVQLPGTSHGRPGRHEEAGQVTRQAVPAAEEGLRHGRWFVKYEAPARDGKRQQRRIGPYDTEKAAKAALAEVIGQAGTRADDKATRTADYLRAWLQWKAADLKPSTLASYAEAADLYLIPALGHIRLGDLREQNARELHAAMRKISRAEDDTEVLRRLLAARATWHGKRISTRPLTDARIRRIHAVLRTALNDASIPVNPAARVSPGKVRKVRPLLWTQPRVDRWRKMGERPAAVMVWTRDQAGAFLDAVEQDRLYALWHLAAFWGLRRNEIRGLRWADLDLAARRLHIRGDVKSDDSDRIIVIDKGTAAALERWQGQQMVERLEWGDGWTDSGRVFTKEDGTPLRPGWLSTRFATLAARAGLPPIRFHHLRHGSASMLLAAGVDLKVVSTTMGHSTSSFTADVYVTVLSEVAEAAASAIEAFVSRKGTVRVSNESAGEENDH
jgi:integrase